MYRLRRRPRSVWEPQAAWRVGRGAGCFAGRQTLRAVRIRAGETLHLMQMPGRAGAFQPVVRETKTRKGPISEGEGRVIDDCSVGRANCLCVVLFAPPSRQLRPVEATAPACEWKPGRLTIARVRNQVAKANSISVDLHIASIECTMLTRSRGLVRYARGRFVCRP
ncbi:hypothetical protein BC834DRAFT_491767 [Gloeopeniophorella convolvens]|nr:hypothetical protein BC834DRAFT_491767 [Gloeopeniophorella convolvens]